MNNTIIKRSSDKWTDLGQILKDHPIKPHVYRTTMKPVAPYAGGFNYHAIVTPSPAYFYKISFDTGFNDKKQNLLDNITMVKAKIEYEKLNEAKLRRPDFNSALNPANY
jgi:hypothetical protein